MSKNHKNLCTTLNYIKHFLILGLKVTGRVSIAALASLIVITSSAIGLNICAITAANKKDISQ